MCRICIFFMAVFLVSCHGTVKTEEVAERPPNILLIMVDDLGKEWVSTYGAEDIVTPNIDALAKAGTKFNNVYSMPQCTPTRMSILTGQYPFRHGWVNHWDVPRWGGGAHFDENVNPSLGKEMKNAGYKTCIAGKWQIDDFRVEPDALTKNGFDQYCMWTGYETGVPESANRYQDPYLYSNGESKTYKGKFGPNVFRDFIIDFIETNKDEPMFIYYPMVLTHTPFVNTPDESAEDNLGKHKAMVRYTDKITGEIMATLKQENLIENTIIVWTTDNGTAQSITGTLKGEKVKGGKTKTTETGICEPFIVSWPGHVAAGQESDALIDFTDFFPTFLDIAGVSPKKEWAVGDTDQIIDGRSFKKTLLNGTDTSQRDWILGMGGGNNAKLTENGVENQYRFRDRVLRNERYKLYIGSDRKSEKFFDLKSDPFEQHNIIDSLDTAERSQNFEELKSVVESFPQEDNDPKYIPNPVQSWDVQITAESEKWKI